MEKSNESDKSEGQENNIEEDPENDEVQKERKVLKRIYENYSNMNDPKYFNSADDVRQAQRHDNGGEGLRMYDVEEGNLPSRNDGDHNNGRRAKAVPKNKKKEKDNNDKRRKSRSARRERSKTRNKVKKVPKKRPGRPTKAGPSRKVKKSAIQRTLLSIYSSSSSLLSNLSSGY